MVANHEVEYHGIEHALQVDQWCGGYCPQQVETLLKGHAPLFLVLPFRDNAQGLTKIFLMKPEWRLVRVISVPPVVTLRQQDTCIFTFLANY